MVTTGQTMWGLGLGIDDPNDPQKQSLINQFNTYGERYGGGYGTSPITQGGLESLNMVDTRNLEDFVAPFQNWRTSGAMGAFASPLGGSGVYVPPVEELIGRDYSSLSPDKMRPHPSGEFIPADVRIESSDWGKETRSQAEKDWYNKFGHEVTHLPGGWQYDNPIDALKASWEGRSKSGLDPTDPSHYGGEEQWQHMHDYMYGIGGGSDPSYLTGRGLMSSPTQFGGRFGKRMGYTIPGGNWTQKAYDKIRGSGLKDWQQGMLMQGPTAAAGQIALGQTSDQVRAQGQAYMDPNRGNYQAPTMTQQGMREEATRTGGTVNPFEATRAVSGQPVRGPHGYKKGGSVDPQEGAATGDLKDWFLDMKGRRPFGRTVRPEPRSKRGDWIDWFLNRRGLAGKFGGSERYKYDSYNPYDYQLFQRGGSVNTNDYQGGGRVHRGRREKLQPRGVEARDTRFGGNLETANIRPREYQPSNRGIANVSNVDDRSLFQGPYEPDFTGELPEAWDLTGSKADQSWQGSGVMAASNGKSWLENNPWLFRLLARRHGGPSDLESLKALDQGSNGGWLGANWDVNVRRGENDSWNLGFTGKWEL